MHPPAGAAAQKDPIVVGNDPGRATQLIEEAERLAQSVTDKYSKGVVLADIAVALAATDPDRAERLARSITTT